MCYNASELLTLPVAVGSLEEKEKSMFGDLREYLAEASKLGDLKVIHGADWNLEIGLITELQLTEPEQPPIVFDNIKGYPPGYRVVTNFMNSPVLFALAHGLPPEARGIGLVNAWRDRVKETFQPVPPVLVKQAPVEQNVHTGESIDLYEFPVPKWHELDGGRYIGTGSMIIQKDPDTGWVNIGTYRVQIHNKNTASISIVPGRHGDVIQKKYWRKGMACPAAVVCGGDPLLWSMAASSIPHGISEYDYAGGLRKEPVRVIRGKTVDLPIPASAEIVLEGQVPPPGHEEVREGPFGEWPGYYAGGDMAMPPFKVSAILHRNEPIILGAPPQLGPFDFNTGRNILRSARVWDELDRNVASVKGVWMLNQARGPMIIVVSIQQMYPGHARQAGTLVASTYAGAWAGKYIIVVDDDIDPSNISEVLWALGTRCDPQNAINIMTDTWSSKSDPTIPPEKRERHDLTSSKAVICACKPYYWKEEFAPSIKSRPEALTEVRAKWGKALFGGR